MNINIDQPAQSTNTERSSNNKADTTTHYRLSKAEQDKLAGREEKSLSKAEDPDVPPHIKRMIDQLKN